MTSTTFHAIVLILSCSICSSVIVQQDDCEILARTESGLVCGSVRKADRGKTYASFRGVPYAQQPLGELRFKELQPVQPWKGWLDATREGPPCPQTDIFYHELMRSQSPHSEACIYANIHVPLTALPRPRTSRALLTTSTQGGQQKKLPVLVFIHGGGFCFGSGDTDIHGPEYLVAKDVVVITFNYRLGPLGFLSLNSADIPGNTGLRDVVTLLRWVQRNVAAFGGNPNDVTIGGQSAGASAAHLLSLSPATKGLFKRVIIMSGAALRGFFSTSPAYAQFTSNYFLQQLGINSTEPKEIHKRLIEMPIDEITRAHRVLLETFGLQVFVPVVESPHSGVTLILDDDPVKLSLQGRGTEYPLLIGSTDNEAASFRPRLEEVNIDVRFSIPESQTMIIPPDTLFRLLPTSQKDVLDEIRAKYFEKGFSMEKIMKYLSDAYFMYPALKTAQIRAAQQNKSAAPAYLYQFSYSPEQSVLKKAFKTDYSGAGHCEDLTFLFRTNSIRDEYEHSERDERMKDWMTCLVVNFMTCSDPTGVSNATLWPPTDSYLSHQEISQPQQFSPKTATLDQKETVVFFDGLLRYIPKPLDMNNSTKV